MFKERSFHSVVDRVNLSTLFSRVGDSQVQESVDGVRGVDLDIHNEDHHDEYCKDNDSVDVTGQESSLKTTGSSVQDNTPRDQKGSQTVVNTSQGFNSGSSTKQKHGSDNDIGTEAEEDEGLVGSTSPTGIDNFTDSVCRRSNLLEVDGKHTKEQDLNGGTRGIPERSRNTIGPGHIGGLKKGGSPSPLRDNDRSSQPSLDHTTSSVEMLRGDFTLVSKVLVLQGET